MKRTTKTVVLTAVGTTLFWMAVIACWFWLGSSSTRCDFGLEYHTNGAGVIWIKNPAPQKVVALVEDLGSQSTNFATRSDPLLRQELQPGAYIRLGLRTVRE